MPPAQDRRPDLVLVIIDTWRHDALGANGAAQPGLTPKLDAVAASGVLFTRAFAASPWTLPSVASTLTGCAPTVHGAHGRHQAVAPVRPQVPLLAERLQAAGYQTVAVVNAPFLAPELGFDRGFDVYDYQSAAERGRRRAARTVKAALDLARQADPAKPLFLLVHFFDPHLPYDPPPSWAQRWVGDYGGKLRPPLNPIQEIRAGAFHPSAEDHRFMRALYHGEVSSTDHELGRFFASLDSLGRSQTPLIVVTADHGEEFADHGGWEHGHTMYAELVQVPLIVVPPPGQLVRARVESTQVRLVDLFPTLLESAGAATSSDPFSQSLWPLILEREPASDRPALSEREHLGRPAAALRDGSWALISPLDGGPSELYDQRSDPKEVRNLADDMPDVVRSMESRLRELLTTLQQQRDHSGSADDSPPTDPQLIEELKALGYLGG